MSKDCSKCTPNNVLCTVESFVSALEEAPVVDDIMLVRNPDGSTRPLTAEEEESLGIKTVEVLGTKTEGEFLPLGAKDHCPIRIVYGEA